jgi:cytochrome b561
MSATVVRYNRVAMALHWIIALLVIANIVLGLIMADLPRSDPNKLLMFLTHKPIGLTVLVLSLLRVGWRIANPVPPLPQMHPALKGLAHLTHYGFYLLIIVVPLSGWLMVSASPFGNGTDYFGIFTWPNLPFWAGQTREQLHPVQEFFEETHTLLAWSAIVLLVLHVAAALYHHVLLKDDVLARMVPWGKVKEPA